MYEIFIDNKKYVFEKNITILQACEQANIFLPRFCYHEKLSIAGNCRMCLIEIEKSPKPIAACAMPISNNMVVFTNTPLVRKAQESILELLLINHPLDCPICDQGGECDLQDLTINFGTDCNRFFELKRSVEDKFCGPIIKTIMTRCIHCTRCVRFLSELNGNEIFGALGRGEIMEIGTYLNKYIKNELSGNLVDICPVGALTAKPYAFLARSWELKKIEGIDFTDAIGSNILIQTRNSLKKKQKINLKDNIIRILPKTNENINEVWISDKTRFAFDGLNISRLNNLLINKQIFLQNDFKEWFPFLKDFINEFFVFYNSRLFIIGNFGTILSIEELYFFTNFLNFFGYNHFLINTYKYNINKDLPQNYQFNSLFRNIEKADLILLIGINPRFEASMLNLKIRKHFFNKNVSINLIGNFKELNYSVNHLGISLKTFTDIIEGRHSFCKKLKNAKAPLIILGTEFVLREDVLMLQNIYKILGQKAYLLLNNKYFINIVHSNLSQIHSCELGLNLNKINNFYNPLNNIINPKIFFFANNLNEIHYKNIFNKDLNHFFCSFNTHRFEKDNFFSYNIPINSFFERNSLLINSEGIVQKNYKSKSPLQISRNTEDILNSIFIMMNFKYKHSKWFSKKGLYLKIPFLININVTRKKFNFNFLKLKENAIKIIFSNFKPFLNNFYMTDNITKNSKIMAECTLFLKNNSNFIKNIT